jgi:(p)ppGpp synthase/HD superfamily hydrolase
MLSKAIALAAELFEDKKDKGGKPYILHCIRVMNSVDQYNEDQMIIAILHDVLEDTEITEEDLCKMGFSLKVRAALMLLTHEKGESYDQYIKRIYHNEDARAVKLADLKDNMDPTRLKGLRQKDFERMEKYQRAFVYLKN